MIDIYRTKNSRRSIARFRAVIFVFVALLFTIPASAQTLVYQFTGTADGFDGTSNFTSKLVRIELLAAGSSVSTGSAQGDIYSSIEKDIIVTSGSIVVDGSSHTLNVTNMYVRRPDSFCLDGSCYTAVDSDGSPNGPNGPPYPGLSVWDDVSNDFYHFFIGDPVPLTNSTTDLSTVQSGLQLFATDQGRGGLGGTGYAQTGGGGNITVNFTTAGADVDYAVFSGGSGSIDYGDAPDTGAGTGTGNYNTLGSDSGPSHFLGGPVLGATVDADSGLLENATATADDLDGTDDEDGVVFSSAIVSSAGQTNTASVFVTVTGATGKIDGWFDFDQNGVFETSEKVIGTGSLTVGSYNLAYTVPIGATTGTTFARFRISTGGTSLPIGAAADGEVEDYQVTVVDGSSASAIGFTFGDGSTQPFTITKTGGNSEISDGTPTVLFSAPFSSVGALSVTGTTGNDTFTINYTGGKVANGTVTIDGDGDTGAPGDQLKLVDGTQDTIEHEYTNANDGFVYYTHSGTAFNTVAYVNLEPITDNLSATHRIFSFNGVANDVTLDFGSPTSTINTTTPTSESTTFTNPSSTVTINGNGGGDTFDVEPSTAYTTTVNGNDPTTLPGDTFDLNANSLAGSVVITLVESSTTAGTYSFDSGGYLDVSYTGMEVVGMRLSDPNAFSGSTYEGDHFYPIHTESGISVEPYFNWDIENWPTSGDAALANITMSISLSSDLSSPVFSTIYKEDGVTLLKDTGVDEDHYITDTDNDTAIPLSNDTEYYWGLTVLMDGGDTFKQIGRFQTIDELMPANTYPEDELIIYDNEFVFSWNVAASTSDDIYWRLDIDETSTPPFDGASPSVSGGNSKNDNDTAGSDGYSTETTYNTSSLSSPLVDGGTYSWRVTTMWPVPPTGWVPQEIHDLDETDRTVSISAVTEFDIAGQAVSAPTPSWPTGGATVYTLNPTLNWFTGGPFDGLTFTVNLTTVAAPTVTIYTATGITGLSQELPSGTLSGSTDYRWTVVSTDGTSTSPTSADALFTTYTPASSSTPVTPTPSYPVDDLEIYTTAPTFHWFTESDNDGQTFKVWYLERTGSAPATCALLRLDGSVVGPLGPVSVTQIDVTGLEPGSTYDWCVEATATGGSLESDVVSFSVGGGSIDAIPIASWPIGNPTVYALEQQLNWYVEGSSLAITSFDVETCSDSAYTTSCTTVTGITDQYYDLTGLSYGQTVYWRVKAHYSGGTFSDWTDSRSKGSFTVIGALGSLTAELTYPTDDLVVSSTIVTFSWFVNGSLEASSLFMIEYSYAETFPSIGNVTKSATTTDTEYSVDDLIPGHIYWWRVKISNDSGSTYGSWSTVASFSVAPGAAPVTPRIGSPANQVFVATGSPTLSWSIPVRSESALTYEVAFGRTSDLSDATTVTGIDATRLRVTDLTDGTYYWQVLSRAADGSPSALSSIGQFVAFGTSTDVEDEVVEIPDEYRLGQNYPNPFNPTTTIEYSVPVTTEVSITVYNVLGQVVRILVNGQVQAGVHRVEWDARDETGRSLTSGLYIYRIQTADYSRARTLVLLK